MELYEVYVTLRDAKGLKDSEVSKGSGVSGADLTNWKKGRSVPKFAKLVKLADFFGVSTEEFAKAVRN